METLGLALRVGLSLACVLGLVWLLSKGMLKGGRRAAGVAGSVQVLARQSLSRSGSLAVVRVGGRALVVGVTEQQVTLLGETDLEALQGGHPAHGAGRQREVRQGEIRQGEIRQGEIRQGLVQQREVQQREVQQREIQQREIQQIEGEQADQQAEAGGRLPVVRGAPRREVVPLDTVLAADLVREQRHAVQEAVRRDGALAGSALSPATWAQAVEAIRERTTRR